ncbi:MAG: hypothetical protein ACYC7D_12495 [Nitrososphaerales archaeon]
MRRDLLLTGILVAAIGILAIFFVGYSNLCPSTCPSGVLICTESCPAGISAFPIAAFGILLILIGAVIAIFGATR